MVIVRLTGGLGNQLFQYATARRVSHILKTSLKLDISAFEADSLRAFNLSPFNIKANIANVNKVAQFEGMFSKNRLIKSIFYIKQKLGLPFGWKIFEEKDVGELNKDILTISGNANIYMVGYWQSDYYFADIQNIIRHELTLKNKMDSYGCEIAVKVNQTQSVSIHVRRGDYVSNEKTNQVHGVCSLEYYQMCVEQILTQINNPHFFIFSDDPKWVKENLILSHPTTYVTQIEPNRDYQDLHLMSICKHNIIANSSFSWWGAWLNANPNKIVFAPKKWFNLTHINTDHRIPKTWIKV